MRKILHYAVVVSSALLALSGATHAQTPQPAADTTFPVIISASGGISRGAYQAGVNWALVQMFRGSRDPEFRSRHNLRGAYEIAVATGASAGNVNAAFSAIEDCIEDTGPGPESSLFWKMWANVGMDQLFETDIQDTATSHSLLTRRYVEEFVFGAVKERMERGGAREDCNIPVGITLTRVRPASTTIGAPSRHGEPITASTQRFATVFSIREEEGRLYFTLADSPVWMNRRLGKVIIGDLEAGTRRLSSTWVKDAMQASGAYPVAFQPVSLRYRDASRLTSSGECGDGGAACLERAVFADGGLFDNNPLTLALEMYDSLPRRVERFPLFDETTYVLYIDTDKVRGDARTATASLGRTRPEIDQGLAPILDMAKGFLPAARQYELQGLARTLAGTGRDTAWLRVTTRSQPMVGAYLNSFAAFLGKPFREYDFYTGIYDGLQFAARNMTRCSEQACEAAVLRGLFVDPTLRLGPLAPRVLHASYHAEYNVSLPPESLPAVHTQLDRDRLHLLEAMLKGRDALVERTRVRPWDNATQCARRRWEEAILCVDGFEVMLDAFQEAAYPAGGEDPLKTRYYEEPPCGAEVKEVGGIAYGWHTSPDMCPAETKFVWFLFDRPGFIREFGARMIHQLWRVEDGLQADPGTRDDAHEGVVELMDFAYNAFATRMPLNYGFQEGALRWDPSSIQRVSTHPWKRVASVLPYWAGFAAGGGGEVGYRPTWDWGRRFSGVFPTSATYFPANGRFEFALGGGVLFRRTGVFLSGVEFNLQEVLALKLDEAPGGAASVGATAYVLGDRLRLSTRYLVNPTPAVQRGNRWAFSVGINDLNGMLYWAGRSSLFEPKPSKAQR